MKKAVVCLADGLEEIEGLTVVDLLRRVGVPVTMVSLKEKERMVTGAHNIVIQAACCFEDVDFADKDLLVLPGGMPGTTNLGSHAGVTGQIRKFYEEGKMIAAICAAPVSYTHLKTAYLLAIHFGQLRHPLPADVSGLRTARAERTALGHLVKAWNHALDHRQMSMILIRQLRDTAVSYTHLPPVLRHGCLYFLCSISDQICCFLDSNVLFHCLSLSLADELL